MEKLTNLFSILKQVYEDPDSTESLKQLCSEIQKEKTNDNELNCKGVPCGNCPFADKENLKDTLEEVKKLEFLNLL